MLDAPYKDKLAKNINRMVEIRLANPNTYKTDHEWQELMAENKHLEAQINSYRNMMGLKPNEAPEFNKNNITDTIQQIYASEPKQ